jgi:hypothetical protein
MNGAVAATKLLPLLLLRSDTSLDSTFMRTRLNAPMISSMPGIERSIGARGRTCVGDTGDKCELADASRRGVDGKLRSRERNCVILCDGADSGCARLPTDQSSVTRDDDGVARMRDRIGQLVNDADESPAADNGGGGGVGDCGGDTVAAGC